MYFSKLTHLWVREAHPDEGLSPIHMCQNELYSRLVGIVLDNFRHSNCILKTSVYMESSLNTVIGLFVDGDFVEGDSTSNLVC